MKAMVINNFGNADVFEEMEVATPTIKPNHVLIEVKASSVNPLDIKIRSGQVQAACPPFPAILNGDVAGVVVEVASDVKEFKVGDEVFGFIGGVKHLPGALAQYVLADVNTIAKKPNNLTMEQAASLPVISITAFYAINDYLRLPENAKILIHGGAGGVGHIALQLAKLRNADIATTIGSDDQIDFVRKHGANHSINYMKESVADYVQRLTDGNGFQYIFDTVGGPNLANSLQAASDYGSITTTASRCELDLGPMHAKSLTLSTVFIVLSLLKENQRSKIKHALNSIAELFTLGKLTLNQHDTVFPFSEISKAHQLLEQGKANGKIALTNDLK